MEGWNIIMKKLLAMLLALAMILSLAACGGSGSSAETETEPTEAPVEAEPEAEPTEAPAEAEPEAEPEAEAAGYTTVEEGKLIMSTNAAFPPYEMVADGEGAYNGFEGIDVEIAVALADKLGLELVIDDMDFDSALVAVQNGKSDMVLAGLTYKEERDKVMDFSTSYATGQQVVIVPDGSDIETMDDLANDKMIGVQRGTTGEMYAADTPENGGYGEDHVLAYDNGALAVQAMLNGQVDAVIIDNGPAQEYVKANAGLHLLEGDWVLENYCLAVDEGNTQLLEALNSALEEMIADGTVQSIIDKYIAAE